jgi:uncharacterized protein (DUF1697 family)
MKYVALLRGIGPGNPNMRNEKLRSVLESLSLENVQSVISSGNVLFETAETDPKKLEELIENEWPKQLGFNSTTIVRSQKQLEELTALDPFKGLEHGPKSYLLVTFFQKQTKVDFKLPYSPEGKTYKLIGADEKTLFTVTDNTMVKTTDLMTWLEKQFTKQISSRTWLTVHRILKKMKDS